jgi:hypothetical protein
VFWVGEVPKLLAVVEARAGNVRLHHHPPHQYTVDALSLFMGWFRVSCEWQFSVLFFETDAPCSQLQRDVCCARLATELSLVITNVWVQLTAEGTINSGTYM